MPYQHPIDPSRALYIKFGESGKHARECFEKSILLFGYREAPLEICQRGDWDAVGRILLDLRNGKKGAASNDLRQIQNFYEADANVLWITIHDNHLWWCFAEPIVRPFQPDDDDDVRDRYVYRRAIGGWSNQDVNGAPLQLHRISTLISKVHGYRGATCSISGAIEFDYLIRKINGEETTNLQAAREARARMVETMEALIGDLSDSDFETLVDLLFRQAGWQRLGDVGGVQKTFDIILLAPVTGERYGVQVKVRADRGVYEEWRADCQRMEDFTAFYFAVQKPIGTWSEDPQGRYRLLQPRRIAELTVDYGLIGWVLEKSV